MDVAADIPAPLVRGVGKLVDLLVAGTLILELGSEARKLLPVVSLVHVSEDTLFYVDNIVGPVALWIYLTVAEAIAGATLGKAVTGTRVVDAETRAPIGLRAAAVRNLILFFDLILFGMIAYSQMARSPIRQRAGDAAAGTVVVKAWSTQGRSTLWGWPVAIVLASLFVYASYVVS